VFHQRHRRHPFEDFIPWNDYRVSGMPPPLPHLRGRSPWGGRRQRQQLGRLLVGIAIVVAVIYLVQRLMGSRDRNSSWL
jgi:hypothetical protein